MSGVLRVHEIFIHEKKLLLLSCDQKEEATIYIRTTPEEVVSLFENIDFIPISNKLTKRDLCFRTERCSGVLICSST